MQQVAGGALYNCCLHYVMHSYSIVTAALTILCSAFVQAAPPVVSADIGGKVGVVRAELMDIERREYITYSEIRLFHNQATTPFQRIAVDVEIEGPYFEFVDLNGDGYRDLVFYRTCGAGYQCVGPSPYAGDVFIFRPKTARFEEVLVLSGRGDVQAAKTRGCATVDYKSGPAGYARETWCIDKRSFGGWKLKSRIAGEPSE